MADALTVQDLEKLAQLQNEINAIRDQLKPTYEKIQKAVQACNLGEELKFIFDFEGKPMYKTNVEWEGMKYEVIFKIKKAG